MLTTRGDGASALLAAKDCVQPLGAAALAAGSAQIRVVGLWCHNKRRFARKKRGRD